MQKCTNSDPISVGDTLDHFSNSTVFVAYKKMKDKWDLAENWAFP